MHPTVRRVAVLAAVALAFVGGVGLGGYLVPPGGHGGGTGSGRSTTFSAVAAGSLGTLFPQVADALVNDTPGVSAPIAAQTYEGSLLALAAVRMSGATPDIAASADFRLIPQGLEPSFATWEVVFATTPEVLAYDPGASALAGINASNWPARIAAPGVVLGVANASTDPNGYNGIFVLQLEGELTNGSLGALYGHFYSTPPGSYAVPNPSTAKVEPETQAATLLASHAVNAFILYRSYAVAHHLAYVDLDPRLRLGDLGAAALAYDAQARTQILNANGGLTTVVGAPVAFSACVPSTAANASLGLAFLNLLLSPQGTALTTADGFSPVVPAWSDHPTAVPPSLRPFVTPLPAGLPLA